MLISSLEGVVGGEDLIWQKNLFSIKIQIYIFQESKISSLH